MCLVTLEKVGVKRRDTNSSNKRETMLADQTMWSHSFPFPGHLAFASIEDSVISAFAGQKPLYYSSMPLQSVLLVAMRTRASLPSTQTNHVRANHWWHGLWRMALEMRQRLQKSQTCCISAWAMYQNLLHPSWPIGAKIGASWVRILIYQQVKRPTPSECLASHLDESFLLGSIHMPLILGQPMEPLRVVPGQVVLRVRRLCVVFSEGIGGFCCVACPRCAEEVIQMLRS